MGIESWKKNKKKLSKKREKGSTQFDVIKPIYLKWASHFIFLFLPFSLFFFFFFILFSNLFVFSSYTSLLFVKLPFFIYHFFTPRKFVSFLLFFCFPSNYLSFNLTVLIFSSSSYFSLTWLGTIYLIHPFKTFSSFFIFPFYSSFQSLITFLEKTFYSFLTKTQ